MKTNRFNIISIFIILLYLTGFAACTDVLNENVYDSVTPEGIPDSDEGADLLVIGTYSKLSNDMFRYSQFPAVLEWDNDYITGPSWAFADLGAGNFQASGANDKLQQMWTGPYTIIHRANVAIKYIEQMQNMTPDKKSNDLGELYFLKAWSYFVLTRSFGEVPIITSADSTNFNQPRKTIPEVYNHIIDLLTNAEDMMYKVGDANYIAGRASAGAAAALLSKVYLTMGSGSLSNATVSVKGGAAYSMSGTTKILNPTPVISTYTKDVVVGYESFNPDSCFKWARDKAKEVIDGTYGTYDLIKTSYADIWSQANKNKTEHIWSLQSKSADNIYGNQISKWFSGVASTSNSSQIASGLWAGMRKHWYTLFEATDTRIVNGVMHSWLNSSGTSVVYPTTSTTSYGIAYLMKYYYVSDRTQAYSDINYPFIRYADVLLIYAEAENELNGPDQTALDELNKVRTRSSATAKVLTDFSDKASLRSFIIEERARELAGEGDRRWDLIRWGIYLQVMNAIGNDENGVVKTRLSKHLLYPIPIAEINTNTALNGENNPGWQ